MDALVLRLRDVDVAPNFNPIVGIESAPDLSFEEAVEEWKRGDPDFEKLLLVKHIKAAKIQVSQHAHARAKPQRAKASVPVPQALPYWAVLPPHCQRSSVSWH